MEEDVDRSTLVSSKKNGEKIGSKYWGGVERYRDEQNMKKINTMNQPRLKKCLNMWKNTAKLQNAQINFKAKTQILFKKKLYSH